MYYNWYEMYLSAKQAQRDLHRQADESRRAAAARKERKESWKRASAKSAAALGGHRRFLHSHSPVEPQCASLDRMAAAADVIRPTP